MPDLRRTGDLGSDSFARRADHFFSSADSTIVLAMFNSGMTDRQWRSLLLPSAGRDADSRPGGRDASRILGIRPERPACRRQARAVVCLSGRCGCPKISQHTLGVSCSRCGRIVEIQKVDAVRLYGTNAIFKDVAQRLLDNTCQQRTGRHEKDGCWPSFE